MSAPKKPRKSAPKKPRKSAPAAGPSWPDCASCDGPALPKGEPSLRVVCDVETRSESNRRDTWGKIKRAQKIRDATIEALALGLGAGQIVPAVGPWYVRMTRLSTGTLDPGNLERSMKHVQDTVAAAIGVDDGSGRVAWRCKQIRTRDRLGVIVEIWGAASMPEMAGAV